LHEDDDDDKLMLEADQMNLDEPFELDFQDHNNNSKPSFAVDSDH
jgi:hypothetical protein